MHLKSVGKFNPLGIFFTQRIIISFLSNALKLLTSLQSQVINQHHYASCQVNILDLALRGQKSSYTLLFVILN